jgi:hypothetical protein
MNRNDTKTMSIPEAGRRYYDLAPGASYRAARAGGLPTVRVGKRRRVSVIALERKLEAAGKEEASTREDTEPNKLTAA